MMEGSNGCFLTLSYYGAEKVVPNYNVMGLAKASLEASVRYLANSLGSRNIRVNAISAGPIKTLAAAGIKDFRKMLQAYADITPLKRNVSIEEVGHTAAFLCSDLASAITGEIVHVDAGFHAIALQEHQIS
jgi:enoyl-[acyl-carrier protein] reductase I